MDTVDLASGPIEGQISETRLARSSVLRRSNSGKIGYEVLNDALGRALIEILVGKIEHDSRIDWTLQYLLILDRNLIYPARKIT